MSIIKANGAGDQDTGFYNGVATTSYRNIPTQTLTRDYGASPTSTKIMSFGGWVKRQQTGHYSNLLSATLGGGGVGQGYIWMGGNSISVDQVAVQDLTAGGATTFNYITTRLVRDTSAWMHLWVRIDTTDSTEGDRVQLWINGVRETSFATATAPSLNADTVGLNQNKTHFFGHSNSGYGGHVYYSDWWWLDGSAVTPVDTVGEFKNGVFIPKNYSSPSFGNKGWHLKFDQTGVGSPSDTTIGADSSGNSRHWTSTANTNVEAHDCALPDSPENNFCTLNHNARGTTNVALSEGALKFVCNTSNNFGNVLGTIPLFSGKWYCEGYMANTSLTQFGVQEVTNNIYQSSGDFGANTDLGMWDSRGYFYDEGTAGGTPSSFANGDIINIAFDVDAGKIWFGKNGTYLFSGDPANGTNQSTGSTNDLSSIGVTIAGNGASGSGIFNCGQDDTFAGNKTSGSANATDSEGIGQFYYSPPSGFLAICTANLSDDDLTISPNAATQATDHFGILTYTGSGSASRSIVSGGTDIGGKINFKPDWLWVKSRSGSYYHGLWDSNRTNKSALYSNASDDEDTSTAGTLGSLDTNGFTTPNVASGGFINIGSGTYVAWNWKANGGNLTTNDASATGVGTIDSTYQANTTAGFSIVTYTGTGSAGSIAHGLGGVPEMMIVKNRDGAHSWSGTYHHKMASDPHTDYLNLSGTGGVVDDSTMWNDTAPTSTVFTVGTASNTGSSDNFVAYLFRGISGYSKFGSYTGNGVADGTFVYTGFRPAWLMVKRYDAANNWHIWDTTRGIFNPMGSGSLLVADDVYYESQLGSVLDILSNGFKPRANSTGYNNGSYIYMAFAENPFKYANAR
jgi:hypothetical protein